MYTHRGAYLQAVAMAYHCRLGTDSDYLWTLPMFHCDGWCLTWAVTAAGGLHRCLRNFDAAAVWQTLQAGDVTHLSGAPTVLTMIAQAAEELGGPPPAHPVLATTGGAPPTPSLLARLEPLNLSVTHLYGLTETYGPAVVNVWQPEWTDLPTSERARLNARQGVGNIVTGGVRVVDPLGATVPADGATIGEIVIRGNNVMAGYYRDPAATEDVFIDGWLRTGDLGVCHPDGYVELRDRAKDIIVTGGENVASVEVEAIICELPAVLEVAVVAVPDELWGEVPVAVVTLRGSATITEDEIIAHVRSRTAHFKAPRQVHFFVLPKTSTGKVQKHELRRRLAPPPPAPH
jgi:fatty-acyl-CoA synthase